MKLIVNGEEREARTGVTIEDLLRELGVEPPTVVVEVNLEIIDRGEFAGTVLQAEDRVEVIRFVGGGS